MQAQGRVHVNLHADRHFTIERAVDCFGTFFQQENDSTSGQVIFLVKNDLGKMFSVCELYVIDCVSKSVQSSDIVCRDRCLKAYYEEQTRLARIDAEVHVQEGYCAYRVVDDVTHTVFCSHSAKIAVGQAFYCAEHASKLIGAPDEAAR